MTDGLDNLIDGIEEDIVGLSKHIYSRNLELARDSLNSGDANQAIIYATYALNIAPESADPYSIRARAYMELDDYESAKNDLIKAALYISSDLAENLDTFLLMVDSKFANMDRALVYVEAQHKRKYEELKRQLMDGHIETEAYERGRVLLEKELGLKLAEIQELEEKLTSLETALEYEANNGLELEELKRKLGDYNDRRNFVDRNSQFIKDKVEETESSNKSKTPSTNPFYNFFITFLIGLGIVTGVYFSSIEIRKFACEHLEGSLPCSYLASEYLNSDSGNYDPQEALNIYQQMCNDGHSSGCNNLAYHLTTGEFTTQDFPYACSLYRLACEGDNSTSCYSLGLHVEVGNCSSNQTAEQLFQTACANGSDHACERIGEELDD